MNHSSTELYSPLNQQELDKYLQDARIARAIAIRSLVSRLYRISKKSVLNIVKPQPLLTAQTAV